ncbi:MAG: hypothetical protein R3D62_18485 [Xanthobacteraceae bacterium]
MRRTPYLPLLVLPVVAAMLLAAPLAADGLRLAPVKDPVVAKECSACHMLYPAGLLPARSWSAMMADLANHFGDNAELDAATTKHIAGYLTANAADGAKQNRVVLRGLASTEMPARITALPWWMRKHEKRDRVAPATLARKGAKFKGDCKACHQDAERGFFDDDD